MSKHQHRMKDRFYSQTTSHLQATTASIRSPMTTTVLTDFTATNNSLEGNRLQVASQTFSRGVCRYCLQGKPKQSSKP